MKNFTNIQSFVNFLGAKSANWSTAKRVALDAIGQHVEKVAKAKFGHYQEAVGEFPKWEQLTDATQTDRTSKGYAPNEPLLRTGELRDSISHKVEVDTVTVGSDSSIMLYQEVGTATIPPRPVLGAAAFESKKDVQKILISALVEHFEG